MAGNNGMKNTFGKIGSRRFIGFSGQSGRKKKTISGNGLERDGKNDQTLLMDDGQKGQIFHPHGSC